MTSHLTNLTLNEALQRREARVREHTAERELRGNGANRMPDQNPAGSTGWLKKLVPSGLRSRRLETV